MPTDRRPRAALPERMPNDADRAWTPAGVFGAALRVDSRPAGEMSQIAGVAPVPRLKRRSQTLGSPPRASKLTAVTPARRNFTTERAYVTAPVQVTAQPCPFGRVPPSRLR